MKRITLRIAIGILAFIIGIASTALWFIYPFSSNQAFDVLTFDTLKTENAEEYDVYSRVINDLFVKDRVSKNLLVISNQTSFYESVGYLDKTTSEQRIQNMKQSYPSVSEETLLDFEAKDTKPVELNHNFNLPVEYLLINAKQLEKSKGYASQIMITLSRVGFNKEKTEAFIYVEYFCPLCGHSNYLRLEKENGLWKIKENFGGWVS